MPWHTKCFCFKNIIGSDFFTDITKSHPYSGGRAGERRECRDQKRAKPERGDHTGQHVNQSRSGTDLLRAQNTLNQKVYFTEITNSLIEYQRRYKQRNKSRDRRLTMQRTTDLGWPAMRRPQTGRRGWRGGGERPTGASSQTHALRPALDLKHKTNTAGHARVQRHIQNATTEITVCF